MTSWQQWLMAWQGKASLDLNAEISLPQAPEDVLALGLMVDGLVDAASLRQARWLGGESTNLRCLLLLMLARLSKGHTRSRAGDLLELARAGICDPQYGWDELGTSALRAAQAAVLPGFCQELSKFIASLSENPKLHAPVTGLRTLDPLPLICIDATAEDVWFGFARHEAATDRMQACLQQRLAQSATGYDPSRVSDIMALLESFPPEFRLHTGQQAAVAKALHERFVILTGGPGTGKTTVVACMLWALLQASHSLHGESVVLCAPTGRAQARLAQSVQENLVRLPGLETGGNARLQSLYQSKSATLHTLLGARPDGSFGHHAGHPLPHQVIVVDEASMIDLTMFAALLDAIPASAHLIVVGDPNQLPSVDAGAVLSDLVASVRCAPHRSELIHTWRNSGQIAVCSQALQGGEWPEVEVVPLENYDSTVPSGSVLRLDGDLKLLLEQWVARWVRDLQGAVPTQRILCATHGGATGRETVNRLCDEYLRKAFGVRGRFVPSQPVILSRNHPERNLWNGDLGIVREVAGELVVEFSPSSQVRVGQLEGLESAWAITVHKSQGSEFQDVLFLLPERDTPMLSRQIVYTALTRARQVVWLWGDVSLLAIAAKRREERPSRLREG